MVIQSAGGQRAALAAAEQPGQVGRGHEQRHAVPAVLHEGVGGEDLGQQHQGAGQVAREEVVVEQAPALDPLLPGDVQVLVAEDGEAVEAGVVEEEDQHQQRGGGQRRTSRACRTGRAAAACRWRSRVPERAPAARDAHRLPDEEREHEADGRAGGEAEAQQDARQPGPGRVQRGPDVDDDDGDGDDVGGVPDLAEHRAVVSRPSRRPAARSASRSSVTVRRE